MRIQRLLDYLKYSELANLNLSNLDSDEENKLKVFSYIDRAVAAVNLEFNINQVEVIINLKPTRTKYFLNDQKLVKLIAAYYSDGTELSLNNEFTDQSVFTPALNIIEYRGTNVSSDTVDDYLSLIWLKGFDNITGSGGLINISEGLLECIASYVGFLAYSTVDKSNDSPSTGYYARYQSAVLSAKANGLNNDDNLYFDKFTDRGFV